jgi:hypothetical protein
MNQKEIPMNMRQEDIEDYSLKKNKSDKPSNYLRNQ